MKDIQFHRKSYLIITGVICLLLYSCDKKPARQIVYYSNNEVKNLIPIFDLKEDEKYLCELLFDGLVNKTSLNKGQENYEWALVRKDGYRERGSSPDERFFISLYLRDDVKWHDGHPFTAEDVLFTWNAIQQSDSPLKNWLNSFIETVTPVSGENFKLEIKLRIQRSPEAFKELFSPIKIIPKYFNGNELPTNLRQNAEQVQQFNWQPIGTGPYKLVGDQRKSASIELVANTGSDYTYFLGKPTIDGVRMVVINDVVKEVKALKGGESGLLFNVTPEFYKQLVDAPLNYQEYLPYNFYAFVYNTKREPLTDIAVRQALNYATDRTVLFKDFIGSSLEDQALSLNHSIFPTNSSYIQNATQATFTDTYAPDYERAATLLKNAKLEDKPLTFLICSDIEGPSRANAIIKNYSDMLKKAGIELKIDDVNKPRYLNKIKEGDFDIVFFNFSGFDHLYDIRQLFKSNAEENIWRVEDTQLQGILKEFGSTLEWEKLSQIAQQIHERVDALAPGCFLFTMPRRAYYANRLTNVTIHPETGFSTIEKWGLKEE